jgi:SH3-like domain-containing protein
MSTSVIAKDTMRSINYQGVNVREGAGLNHAVLWRVVKYFPYKIIKTRGVWKNVQDFEGDR